MTWFSVAVVLFGILSVQQPDSSTPQDLPAYRVVDTYSVYDAALSNAIGNHAEQASQYFISNHTGQTYLIADADKCVHVPAEDGRAFGEAVADFRAQKGNVYRLENYFNFKKRKLRLLAPDEEKAIVTKLEAAAGGHISDPTLDEATDVIRLSNVGFSLDRSLAIVVVSNYCGVLCGEENWRIFKRVENGWREQQWERCSVVSQAAESF